MKLTIVKLFVLIFISSTIYSQESEFEYIRSKYPLDEMISELKEEGKLTKDVLAVLEIESNNNFSRNISINLADILITALSKYNKFDIVERDKMKKIIEEQNLQMSGIVDENTAVEIGRILGAETLAIAKISSATDTKIDKFSYTSVEIEVGVDIRFVDIQTGKVLKSESAKGLVKDKIIQTSSGVVVKEANDYNISYTNAARKAVDKAAKKLVEENSLNVGFIIKAEDDDNIMLDLGSYTGITNNSKLLIFRADEELIHPVTGKTLGWEKKLVGELEIFKVDQNFSYGKIDDLIKDDVTPKIGDFIVEIITKD